MTELNYTTIKNKLEEMIDALYQLRRGMNREDDPALQDDLKELERRVERVLGSILEQEQFNKAGAA